MGLAFLLPNRYNRGQELRVTVKKLVWVGSSYKDLVDFPPPVRQAVGYALFLAQNGKMHEHTKVLSGVGSAGGQGKRQEWDL